MYRLNLSSYLFIICVILILALGISRFFQWWVVNVSEETGARIERAGRIYQ